MASDEFAPNVLTFTPAPDDPFNLPCRIPVKDLPRTIFEPFRAQDTAEGEIAVFEHIGFHAKMAFWREYLKAA